MFDVQAVRHGFDRAALAYDAQANLQRQVRGHCLMLAREYWPEGAHILDAGCGTGALAQDVAGSGAGWHITGLDLAFGMCEAARQKQALAVNANADAMPFADGCFDGVFSSLMLQWANDPQRVLRQMARVTAGGGRCVLATLTQDTLHELRSAFAVLDEAPHVSDFLTPTDLFACVELAGWSVALTKEMMLVEHYPDALSLMRALKAIGAANKQARRHRGLMTPLQLSRLEQEYARRFGASQGLPATWHVLYMVLEKK